MSVRPGASAAVRRFRAASVAITGLGLAVTMHVLAGGPRPSATVCVLLVAALGSGLAPVVGRPLSRVRAVALVLGVQGLVHVALMLATAAMPARLVDLERRTGHHPVLPTGEGSASHGMTHAMETSGVEHTSSVGAMALGHAVAAVLLGLLLASVDRSLSTLMTVLATLVHVLRLATWARALHVLVGLRSLLDLPRLITSALDLAPPARHTSDVVRRRGPPSAVPAIP